MIAASARYRYVLGVVLLSILCSSCTEELSQPSTEEGLVPLSLTLGTETRTTLNGFTVLWEESDRISVLDLKGNREFKCSGSGKSASFSGGVSPSPRYGLLYPYDPSVSMSDGVISTSIPSGQDAVSGSFASGAALSAGMLTDGCLSAAMRSVCSFVSFTVNPAGRRITSVRLESGDGTALSGPVKISFSDDLPVTEMQPGALSYVTMTSSSPIGNGTYYLAVCPCTVGGFKLSFILDDGTVLYKTGKNPVSFVRNRIVDLGTISMSDLVIFEDEPDDTSADPVSAYASFGVEFSKLTAMGHPRLFMTQADFEYIKRRVAATTDQGDMFLQVHNSLIKNADSYAASSDIATHTLIGKRMLTQSRNALQRMFHCAYAYKTTGDDKYLTKARTELSAVCAFPDWNDTKHFLDPSEMSLAVAVVYDWLYYDLTLEERVNAHNALKNFDLTPFKKYSASTTNNWNQVCNGGAIAAAIALYEKDKALCAYDIDKAIKSNLTAVEYMYEPLGNGIEGNGYWKYAMSYQEVIITGLETAFGTCCGMDSTDGLRRSGLWMLYMDGPTGGFNFSDSGSNSHSVTPQLVWLAAKFGQPELLVKERSNITSKGYTTDRCAPLVMCGLVRYPLEYSGATYPSSRIWAANDLSPLVIARLGWNYDDSDKYVGLKGCGAYNNHSHMDAGHFVYDAYGQRWATDTSMGNYNDYEQQMSGLFGRTQKSTRWDILCQNNYFHNTLSFIQSNGTVDKWHVTDHITNVKGELVETYENDTDGYGGKVDLSVYFSDAASSVFRTAVLRNGDLYIKDEITSLSNMQAIFEWRMLTKADITVEKDYLVLTLGGKTVYLYTVADGDVSLSVSYGKEDEVKRPATWMARTWDSLQSYAGFHVAKYSAGVKKGLQTATFTTVISSVKPGDTSADIGSELPGLDDRTEAQW